MGENENSVLDIIRENVIKDYYTAGFKAEVTFDTLLAPLVAGMIQAGLDDNEEIEYVTKEFPVLLSRLADNENVNGFSSINVDYVLCSKTYVYFVELKTTMESMNKKQKENYLEILKIDKNSNMNDDMNLKFDTFGNDFIALLNHNCNTGIGDVKYDKDIDNSGSEKLIENITDKNFRHIKDIIASKKGVELSQKELLKAMFDRIYDRNPGVSNDKPECSKTDENNLYVDKAINYLKNLQNAKGKKYMFQAGQIIDCEEDLWGKKIKVVYLVPNHGRDGDNKSNEKLYEGDEGIKTIEIIKCLEDLKKLVEDQKNSFHNLKVNQDYIDLIINIMSDLLAINEA